MQVAAAGNAGNDHADTIEGSQRLFDEIWDSRWDNPLFSSFPCGCSALRALSDIEHRADKRTLGGSSPFARQELIQRRWPSL